MARKTLVEVNVQVFDEDGIAKAVEVGDTVEEVWEKKKAWFHHWGSEARFIKDNDGNVTFAYSVSVGICEDYETGQVFTSDPNNIIVIGQEPYDFKKRSLHRD